MLLPGGQRLVTASEMAAIDHAAISRGTPALALMEHLRLTGLFYIGDEDTDETVFALTRGLTMGVRVGQHAGSHARFYLHHQGEVEEVLRFLVHQMDRPVGTHGESGPQDACGFFASH